MFQKAPIHIGAEQEFCLVNEFWDPSDLGVEILADINDEHFTSELNKYNLELNLDPLQLGGRCFSELHLALNELLIKAKKAAEKHQAKVILTGILPTITHKYLHYNYMTPAERYKVLNEAIKAITKG